MLRDLPADWYEQTHAADLRCAGGKVLRRREWGERGLAGCLASACPNPECILLKRADKRKEK